MKQIPQLLFLFLPFFILFKSNAQSVRIPNEAESAAVNRVAAAITGAFNNFDGDDWEKMQDYFSVPSVTIHPSVPIDIDQNFERDYQLKEKSPTFNKLIMPLIDKMNNYMNQKKYDSVQALGKKISAMSKFTAYAYVNRQSVNIHPGDKNLTPVDLTGCDYACKANEDQYSNETKTYWILFGNWKNAQWNEDNQWLRFHFTHPANSPYIENVVVLIIGDNDYIKQVIQKTDWIKIKNALTL